MLNIFAKDIPDKYSPAIVEVTAIKSPISLGYIPKAFITGINKSVKIPRHKRSIGTNLSSVFNARGM